MNGINGKYVVVPMSWPITAGDALTSDIVDMKGYDQCDLYIMIGTVTKAAAVTLHQGASVSAAATSLSFTKYWSTGFKLKYDAPSSSVPAAAAETVTGAAGGIGYVYQDTGGMVICYAFNGTAFVDNELLTFSGGKTATCDGTLFDEDIMVPQTASSDTFNITAVANKVYCIPIHSSMLTDGMSCVEVNVADPDASGTVIFAVLSEGRYMGDPSLSGIY